MIKLVVSDIDGTLSCEGTVEIDKKIIVALSKLMDKGIKVVLASGRSITEMNGLFSSLNGKIYYISNNGGFIKKGDIEYYRNPIKKENAKKFLSYLLNSHEYDNMPIITSTLDGKTNVLDRDVEIVNFLKKHYKSSARVVSSYEKFYDSILKINIYCEEDVIDKYRKKLNEVWKDKFSIVVSGKHWIDICDVNTEKGNAVNFLKKKYNIKDSETVVLGDNFNDISMLKVAKYSFSPYTSNPIVKKYAKYIMPSYKDEGPLKVFDAILKYGVYDIIK